MADQTGTDTYALAEFILRQRTISDGLANALLLALPSPSGSTPVSPSLRRAILLRALSSDVSNRRISTRTLLLIELLHSLYPRLNPLASDAYLSVAGYIVTTAPDFVSAVLDVFMRRVGAILKSPDASGLVTDQMKTVSEEMEKALTDHGLRSEIAERYTLEGALDAVTVFLNKEQDEMWLQPCLLETTVQRKASLISNSISSPQVKKVVEELKMSCAELLEKIEDPLPEAIRFADEIADSLHRKVREDKTGMQVDKDVPENFTGKDVNQEGTSTGIPKRSLMDRQPTASHYEWSETQELSSDNSEGVSRRFHLTTPRRIPVSPLRQVARRQPGRRRRFKKWSGVEEDTLRKAVEEFGRGNWKLMLDQYRYIFDERTEVDLKDKWRNMTKG